MEVLNHQIYAQRVILNEDLDALSRSAASRIVELAHQAIKERGVFHLALSGGSTPVHLHQVLASPAFISQIPWQQVHVYFGDERNVPYDDPDSNYRMARETLLTHVDIPEQQVHPIPTGCDDMQACARDYATTLSALPQTSGMPCLDLILLGMGNDGHTASLFPGTDILNEQHAPVAAVFVPKLDTWRISLTYPVLSRARMILFLVSGEGKAEVLDAVFNQPNRHYPVQGVQNDHIEWFVDKAAAKRLIESDVGISG